MPGSSDLPSQTQPPIDLDLLGGDLPVASAFLFELDDVQIGVFKQVSGLVAKLDTSFEVKEGGQNEFVHKFPGRMAWDHIVFKRGLTNSDALFKWFEHASGEGFAAKGDKFVRSTGEIIALSSAGTPLRSWILFDAFPVRWSGPTFAADSYTPLEEELEIAHHGFGPETHTGQQR